MRFTRRHKTDYKDYSEVVNLMQHRNSLLREGFIFIPRRTYKTIGAVLIGVGLITLPIPCTTAPLIAFGFLLIGVSKRSLKDSLRHKYKLALYRIRARRNHKRDTKGELC